MTNKNVLIIANVSLFIICIILILTLFEVKVPTTGMSIVDKEEMLCVVNWRDNYNSWTDIDSCCLEARKQLTCVKEQGYYMDKTVQWRCQTGELSYWLDSKAYNYCNKLSVW
ncbi:hypothetical protein COY27_01235 [Candidatus Woesearchaeota archaeon CG_4_10_14_0_2_um_filter_33_13]|nr:MAG: hypothetical protein COY27_01235 [Candidatus Woesearchaeota archaeon CG_4_10_14_0_2_um_filter_33_13]